MPAKRFWILLLLCSCSVARADEREAAGCWPALFGPSSRNLAADQLPLEWSSEEAAQWKAAITGYGQSCPVIWNEHVIVTSISGSMKENCHITAFDLNSGKKLWQRDFAAPVQVENTNYTSKAAPSPVADSNGVVVLFESGLLVALDYEGQIRWQTDLIAEHGPIPTRHGLGSSLAQNEEVVFVWVERQEDPYLLAVEKSSGRVRWKVPGLGAASWSTPVLLPVGEQQHLVISGSGKIAGHDPSTGEQLWTFDKISGNTIPSPQPVGDGCFLIGATVGRGEETAGRAAESNGVIQVSRANGGFQVSFKWHGQSATSSFASPIIHDGRAYFVNATGVLYCLDAQSGQELFVQRLDDSSWATPLAVGDRIYFFGRSGTTTVLQSGAEFKKLAENRLWPKSPATAANEAAAGAATQYAVAAVAGRLLIRTGESLYCLAPAD